MPTLIKNKTLSEMLLELYSIPESGDFFGHALSVLDARTPSSISGYWFAHVDAKMLEGKAVNSHAGRKLPDLDELSKLLQSHPCLEAYCANRTGPVWRTTDVMSEKEWKRLPLYNEVYRPLGVVHDTHVRFYSGELCIIFAFTDSHKMEEEYYRLLSIAAPHLESAYSAFNIQQKGWLCNLPDNTIQLSAEGRMAECPALARTLLDRYFPHRKRASAWNLPEDVQRWIAIEIQRTTAEAGEKKTPRTLMARTDGTKLHLHLIRYASGYLIMLEEVVLSDEIDLLLKLGLTHREAEVLSWVAKGKQNSDVACILNIKTPTIRKHIEHIFEKLGCESRGAAQGLALKTIQQQRMNCIQVKCLSCNRPVCISCDETSTG